jgi:aminopeptidase 2
LFDEKSSALKSRERIAYVVGHELAHQWFGNLVSPEWWADLWLNEGFATWAGWLATDKLFPEWNVWTSFVSNDLQRGLSLDALVSSHPIEVPVKNPHEIHQIFDAISYSKGASVIRMLASYMGAEDFRQGVNNYLKKFKFSNARTQDLWHYLEAAAHGKPIAKLMHSWTRLTGYPVVTVDSESGTALKVKQDRFLSSGAASFDQNKVNWFVPLQIITDAQPQPGKEVLDEKQATIALEKASKEFFKLNHNHTGFFRTFYKEKDLENIGKNIKKLSTSDRIGLVSDLFALSQAGYGSSVSLLKLLDHHYRDEDNYIVWSEIATSIANLKSLFRENEQVYSKLKKLSRNLFSPIVERLGWEFADEKTEGYLKQLLRTLAISVAGKADDEKVVMEAKRRFELFVGGQESALHPNIRGAVFAIVLANDDGAAYEKVVRLYKETKTVDQKLIALSSLGSAKTDELLMKTLQFGMNPDNVRPQDIIYVIGTVAANPKGCKLAWKFVKDNWQTLYDRYYTGSMSLLARVVSSTTEDFSSEEYEKDVTDFFAGKDLPAISRAIEQSLEKIRVHTQWLKRETLPVQEWASKY